MREILEINLPGFSAKYDAEWVLSRDFSNIKNARQVNGILFDNSGRMLIINVIGNWQLPGGHIEEGESFKECLLREIKEEADVEVEKLSALGYLKLSKIKEGEKGKEFIQIKFVGKIKKLNKQTIDPAHGKVAKRKLIDPKEFTGYVPWGNVGKALIDDALKFI